MSKNQYEGMYLCTDRQVHISNWTNRKEKQNCEFYAIGTADLSISYVLAYNFNYDASIQPNGFVERFNGSFRREFLDAYLFEILNQVREMAWFWRLDYNEERTHESLGNLPPAAYRAKLENSKSALSH